MNEPTIEAEQFLAVASTFSDEHRNAAIKGELVRLYGIVKSLDAQPVPETVAWMTEFGRVISAKEKEWAVSKINEGGEFAVTAKAALSYNIKLGVIK